MLIDFWTWDRINCQHTLPHVRDVAKKYESEGLVVIGVHTPEYPPGKTAVIIGEKRGQ